MKRYIIRWTFSVKVKKKMFKKHKNKLFFLMTLCCSLVTFAPVLSAQESNTISFPLLDSKIDPNDAYLEELIALILKNSPRQYKINSKIGRMQQDRSIYEMTKKDGKLDLMWTMTTDGREKKLIPIKIPIDKGLMGWRVVLIDKKNQERFRKIRTLNDLKEFSAGQERDWPDTDILRSNQLTVVTSNGYNPLFSMLMAGRFDYFPRSIFEVNKDIENHPLENMIIDQNIVIIYPTASYFFVSPRRPKLAEDLRIGFEKIIADGSFEKLFQKHNHADLEKLNVNNRIKIHLKNPLLKPNSMDLNRKELWYFSHHESEK